VSTDHLYVTKASYDVMKSRAQARCAALEIELARERESRKQAEAALERYKHVHGINERAMAKLAAAAEKLREERDKAFNAGIEAAAKAQCGLCAGEQDGVLPEPEFIDEVWCHLVPVEHAFNKDRRVAVCESSHIRALSKPVQEPAERERGK
jgi:hypothetical protein